MKRTKRTKTNKHTTGNTNKKGMTSLQKARAAQKEIRAKLAALRIEFKNKLQSATQKAHQKALAEATRLNEQRTQARDKAIAIAEAKFDKKIAKTLSKKTNNKKRRKTTTTNKRPSNTRKAVRRNRPSNTKSIARRNIRRNKRQGTKSRRASR